MDLRRLAGIPSIEEKRMREVYLRAPGQFQLGPYELLQLLNPLYRLMDAVEYWCNTFTKHMRKDLKWSPQQATYLYGIAEFWRESSRTEKKFE